MLILSPPSPHAATTEAHVPGLCSIYIERNHHNEEPQVTTTRECPRAPAKTECNQKQIHKYIYICRCVVESYLAIKKKPDICSNMDEPREYNAQWNKSNKSDRKRQINAVYHLHVESKKIIQINQYTKEIHKTQKTTNRERDGEKNKLGIWD